jgi:AmmeMemoRadiSam system protein A
MFSLDNRQKLSLLSVARRAMRAAVLREPEPTSADAPTMPECSGAFVTLRRRGKLRGCIGQLAVKAPMAGLVAYAAKAAALEDPRFSPVRADEFDEIEIELSLLSEPQAIKPDQIEAGHHGLIVSRGFQRGLLLPQVATEHGWNGLRLLEETCVKAGLEPDAWKDAQTGILAFTALVFSESEIPEAAAT